jgi:hypothetical protein
LSFDSQLGCDRCEWNSDYYTKEQWDYLVKFQTFSIVVEAKGILVEAKGILE